MLLLLLKTAEALLAKSPKFDLKTRAAVQKTLALYRLDRGTVNFHRVTIEERAKQKTHTTHSHTHSRTRASTRRCVGVSGCSFYSFLSIFLAIAF